MKRRMRHDGGGAMLTWEISGGNLPTIRIRAASFDEALAEARTRRKGYCRGRVAEDDRSENQA